MKYRFLIILWTLLAVVQTFSAFATDSGHYLGGISTVADNGPFDVFRNPALLTRLKGNAAIGLETASLIKEIPRADGSVDALYEGETTISQDCQISLSPARAFEGAIAIAVKPTETVALALGYFQGYNRSRKEIRVEVVTGSSVKTIVLDYREEDIVYALTPSAGFNISDALTLGFKTAAVSRKSNMRRNESQNSTNSGLLSKENEKTLLAEFNLEPSMGLLWNSYTLQVGLILGIGSFSWSKEQKEMKYQDILLPSNSYDQSGQTSLSGKMTKPPYVHAGMFLDINSLLGIGVEVGLHLPSTYNKSTLTAENNELRSHERKIVNKNTYSMAAGMRLSISHDIILNLGSSYQHTSYTDKSHDYSNLDMIKKETRHYMISAGADCFATQKLRISLSTQINYNRDILQNSTSIPQKISLDLSETDISLSVRTGFVIVKFF